MIHLSDSAVNEIKRIVAQDPTNDTSCVRVKVVGGGCSGMSYKLDFDKAGAQEKDKVFERDGVTVLVDTKSYIFLKDTTLDYSGGLNGSGFTFNNPNAKKSCGCGASFAV